MIIDVSPDGRYLLYGSDEKEQMNLYRYGTDSGGDGATDRLRPTDVERDVRSRRGANRLRDQRDRRPRQSGRLRGRRGRGRPAPPRSRRTRFGNGRRRRGPDGTSLLVEDNADNKPRAGVYDLERDTVRWLGDGEHVEYPSTFTLDGSHALVTRTRRAATVPVVYDLETGDGRELDLPEGVTTIARRSRPAVPRGRSRRPHAERRPTSESDSSHTTSKRTNTTFSSTRNTGTSTRRRSSVPSTSPTNPATGPSADCCTTPESDPVPTPRRPHEPRS